MSSTLQHTAGPWEFNLRTGYIYGNVGGPDYESVAVVKHIIYSQGEDTREANAALIAAAPEMLEALKGLLTTRCLETYDWDGVKALINKAENKQ